MPVSVTMPRLGESMTEGTVTRWLKQVGEGVTVGEPLLEISTDKVDTEITSPASGVLSSIMVVEERTVEVGVDLATITEGDENASVAEAGPGATGAVVPEAPPPSAPSSPSRGALEGETLGAYLTPLVRKLASEHSIDSSTVTGTGAGGRITKSDVIAAADRAVPQKAIPPATPSTAYPRGEAIRMSRLRRTIATRLVESLQVSAQLTTVVEADVTKIAQLRESAKAEAEQHLGTKLSFLPFFALATIEALKAHPNLNASVNAESHTVTYHEGEHLGIAVDTERGLLVPVIRNAGDLSLGDIARAIADLADRTRSNNIGADELDGSTFTLTNTGSRGALFDTPIINQPAVGILGTGAVVRRPAAIKDPQLGEIVAVRSLVYLALTYDHRIVDGADAARFLTTIKNRLEAGEFEGSLDLSITALGPEPASARHNSDRHRPSQRNQPARRSP